MLSLRTRLIAMVGTVCLLPSGATLADDFPNHPIKLVVPFEPGGGADLSARFMAQQLSEELKQTVIVENRPAQAGIAGAQYVVDSKPDGYTILFGGDVTLDAPMVMKNVTLDVQRDLAPLTKLIFAPYVVVVNLKIPANTPKELVEFVKAHPKDFSWGVAGYGGGAHLTMERFDKIAGIDPLKVPYKGNAPALVATMAGEIGGMMATPSVNKGPVEGGKVRAIGVANLTRLETMPSIPTFDSQGFPGFEGGTWSSLWLPKGVPDDIADKLFEASIRALQNPDLKKKMIDAGFVITPSKSRQEFGTYLKSEAESTQALIKSVGIKPIE